MQQFCRVAIDSPVLALDRPFDYEIPERLLGKVGIGSVVRVVLHGRGMRAFVTDLLDASSVPKTRPLRSLVSSEPVFGAAELDLARWLARRYVVSLGAVLHDAVPGRFSAPGSSGVPAAPPATVPAPAWLRSSVEEVIEHRGAACVVPPTVREEIELAAYIASAASARDGRALIICPRVGLAEAVAARVPAALVLHGSDRPAERAATWAAARDGGTRVVVGGRSALLVPMPGLRVVCVLSAHDRSLKAERAPRTHALVAARRRAALEGAAFLASSPAPPSELWGDDSLVWIGSSRSHVRTEVVRPRGSPVTRRLIDVARWAIEQWADVLVFVGRRGTTLALRCQDCGWMPECPTCGAGLVREGNELACRVCGAQSPIPVACAACGGALLERGWGHERVARALETEIGAPVVRIVRGVVPESRPHPAVLVGTLAAAHEVTDAAAVCVADLDSLLARPDYRAAERAVQTLYELAGSLRPGGRFLVQTREPDHHAVQAFTRQSYPYFVEREQAFREQTGYPPFGVVVRVQTVAGDVAALRAVVEGTGADVIGTVPQRGGVSALIRGPDVERLLDPLRAFATEHPRARIDVDPVDVI